SASASASDDSKWTLQTATSVPIVQCSIQIGIERSASFARYSREADLCQNRPPSLGLLVGPLGFLRSSSLGQSALDPCSSDRWPFARVGKLVNTLSLNLCFLCRFPFNASRTCIDGSRCS